MNLHTEMTSAHQFPESDTAGGTTKNTESSNGTAAQGQSQSPGKPIGSAAARFQIRSAKTLQFGLTNRKFLENKSQTVNERFYESNKSKSLDWRGAGTRSGYGNTAGISSGTQNLGQNFIRHADSLDRKEVNNKITSYTEENQPKSPPWRIQAYNASGQGDRRVHPVSGSTPRLHAMEQAGSGQSLPARLKPRFRQGSIGDTGSLWEQVQQGESSFDQTDHRMGSRAQGQVLTNTEEVTGNQTIKERIKKLYEAISTDTKSDANSKDLTIDKRNCTSDFDHLNSDTINSIPRYRNSSTDSPSGILSLSESQQRRPSYTVEKAGTFPRWFSKNEQTNQMQQPSRLENKNDQRDSSADTSLKPKWSMETSSGKQIQSHLPAENEKKRSPEFCSRSLERARIKFSETAQSRDQRTHGGMTIQSSCSDGSLNISNQSVKHLATTSGGIKAEKQEPDQPKFLLASRGVAHSEKHQEVEDISTVKTEGKRGDGVLETPRSPSSDSVKNTIHKFEALAQQNKSAPQVALARRTLSVPEHPKLVVHVKKSDSDINLRFRKVVGNTEEANFIKDNASEEPKGNVYVNRTSQLNPIANVKPTSEQKREIYKTNNAIIPTFKQLHEPQLDHHISTCDENKRRSVDNRYIDEPDLAMTPRTGPSNKGAMEDKAKNPTFQSTVFQRSNARSLLKQQSIHVNVDDDDDDDDDDTPTNSPNSAPPTINMQRQSNPGTPAQSVKHSDIGVSTPVKSAINGTQPKAVSNPSQSFVSMRPVQTVYSLLNNSNNNNYNTRREPGPVVSSMARWSSDEEDDDDDDYEGTDSEEDSDSGESSVTITSNMSQSERKSFSVSYVDLCIYGGVDYKPSDGSESEDDCMPSRSASLSSDISAFSSVTLLSTDELDRLLDDVRSLGDDTLQKYEDVQVVVLHKEVGSGLGFTLAGGVDQNKPVTVHRVIPGGVAAQEGSVFEGAWVLSINGTPLQKCAHGEALRTLKKAKSQVMAVVVLQRGYNNETQHRKAATHRSINTGRKVHVTLNKSTSDLGFSLEGGVDSSSGDKPLTVQKIFHGGPVSQVFPGDELLEVQGQSLMGMRRLEAWNLIKRLPPGPVEVLLNRPHKPY